MLSPNHGLADKRNGPWAVPKSFESSYTETFSLQKCKNRDTCSRFLRICEANSIKTCAKRTKGTPKACLFCVPPGRRARKACAISCRIPAKPEQAGQAHRSAPHKIPHKSPALPDFYTAARAVAARPRPPCGREGGISKSFFGTF